MTDFINYFLNTSIGKIIVDLSSIILFTTFVATIVTEAYKKMIYGDSNKDLQPVEFKSSKKAQNRIINIVNIITCFCCVASITFITFKVEKDLIIIIGYIIFAMPVTWGMVFVFYHTTFKWILLLSDFVSAFFKKLKIKTESESTVEEIEYLKSVEILKGYKSLQKVQKQNELLEEIKAEEIIDDSIPNK